MLADTEDLQWDVLESNHVCEIRKLKVDVIKSSHGISQEGINCIKIWKE